MVDSGLVYQIPQEILDKAGVLLTILQALGVIVILYIVYYVVMALINRKRLKVLDEMNGHLIEIKEILRNKK